MIVSRTVVAHLVEIPKERSRIVSWLVNLGMPNVDAAHYLDLDAYSPKWNENISNFDVGMWIRATYQN